MKTRDISQKTFNYLLDINGTIVDPYQSLISDEVCEFLIAQTENHRIDVISGQPVSEMFNKIGLLADHIHTMYGHSGSEVLMNDNSYMEPHAHEWDEKLIQFCEEHDLEYLVDYDTLEVREAFNHKELCDEMKKRFPKYDVVLNTMMADIVVQSHGKDIVLPNYNPSELIFVTDVIDEYSYDYYSALRFEEAGAKVIRIGKVEDIFNVFT